MREDRWKEVWHGAVVGDTHMARRLSRRSHHVSLVRAAVVQEKRVAAVEVGEAEVQLFVAER